MNDKKIKRRIWLKPTNVKFVKKEGNNNFFELLTMNSTTKEVRKIQITTIQDLISHATSDVPKELGFDIWDSEKDNNIWNINDENNSIKIWKRNLKEKTIVIPKAKVVINNETKTPLDHSTGSAHVTPQIKHGVNKEIKSNTFKELQDNFFLEISKLNEKQIKLESQIQNLLHNQTKTQDLHVNTGNLQQINETLREILLKMGEGTKLQQNESKNKKTQFKRDWKEKGFVSVRTYSNPQKIKLIQSVEQPDKIMKIYLLKTLFHKELKEITINTEKDIIGNFQINFYIHKEHMQNDCWNINDQDNQIIFYEVDKNYVYRKR